MNKIQENIVKNMSEAIKWSTHKYFDQDFHGVTLSDTATLGFEATIGEYSNFFTQMQELDTSHLPSEESILDSFNSNMALISEDYFITGSNGVVKTDTQFFTAKQLIQALKGKKVFIISK